MNFLFFNKVKKTGIIYEKNLIKKFATDKKSFKLLKNECCGYNWYKKFIKNEKTDFFLKKKNKIYYFATKKIEGLKLDYWNSINKNFIYAEKVINFYKKNWLNINNFSGAHGDLTFSNIIFMQNSQIEIIDWENYISKEDWGYDLCYFIISIVSLPSINSGEKKFTSGDLLKFEILWKKAFNDEKYVFSNNPIFYLKKKYNKFFKYRKIKEFFPNKLNNYQSNQIKEITV